MKLFRIQLLIMLTIVSVLFFILQFAVSIANAAQLPDSFAVEAAYSPPEGSDGLSGLVWNGHTLWSCNEATGKIYKHNMDDSLSVQREYDAPGGHPYGLAWDGQTLWSADWVTNKIYKHNMDSSLSVAAEFNGHATYRLIGLAWDGNNFWSSDIEVTGAAPYAKIRKHNMDSTLSIAFEADSPGETRGLSFTKDDGTLWSTSYLFMDPAIYTYHMDSSLTVAKSYTVPGFSSDGECESSTMVECNGGWTGLAWVNDHLWIANFFLGDSQHAGKSIYKLKPIKSQIEVAIDIKPGNKQNVINPRKKGGIWVAILSDTDTASPFDPSSQVDIPSVEFGPDGAMAIRYKVKDINNDGLGDLLLHFKIRETGIACGDTEATLIGETFDGISFTGTDSIKTAGCEPKKCHKKKHRNKHQSEKHNGTHHRKHHDDDRDDDEKHHGRHKEKEHHERHYSKNHDDDHDDDHKKK